MKYTSSVNQRKSANCGTSVVLSEERSSPAGLLAEEVGDNGFVDDVLAEEFGDNGFVDDVLAEEVGDNGFVDDVLSEIRDDALSEVRADETCAEELLEVTAELLFPFFARRFFPTGDTRNTISATAAAAAIMIPAITPVFGLLLGWGEY